jgi:hypothetical protein
VSANTTSTANITPRAITGTVTAVDKVYDRSTAATTSGTLTGVIVGDTVALDTAGAFRDRNAGSGKTVDVSGVLTGADATNYTVTSNTTAAAAITPRPVAATIVAADKVYDGTTAATTSGTLAGVLAGDEVGLVTQGAFRDPKAGARKQVDVSGVLAGSDAANYAPRANAAAIADVTPATLLVTAIDVVRTVDGLPFSGGGGVTYQGFIPGEDASLLAGSLLWGGSAQGAIRAGSYSLAPSGLAASNYRIHFAEGVLTMLPGRQTPESGQVEREARQGVAGAEGSVFSGAQQTGTQASRRVPLIVADDFLRVD